MMRLRFSGLGAVFLVVFASAGCFGPRVAVRHGYDFRRIHRVALLGFPDYPKAPGSGEIVTSAFEKALLMTGYTLIDRRLADQILKDRALGPSGAFDLKTIIKAGHVLSVDVV